MPCQVYAKGAHRDEIKEKRGNHLTSSKSDHSVE